jgi:hypothetical protein
MALEETIADAGALLVQLNKFRAGAASHTRLLADTMALGDRARRHLRAQALDAATDAELAREATALRDRVQSALDDVRSSPAYGEAVAAHGVADYATLARLLPAIFTGLRVVPVPAALWYAPPWQRRSRPRPASEMAAAILRLATDGLEPDADPLAPGLDPELPAVPLDEDASVADPVLLRWRHDDLPPSVFRLDDSGALLVHVTRLTAPFAVVLPETLDDDELGEVSIDHPRYRAELLAALAAVGIRAGG